MTGYAVSFNLRHKRRGHLFQNKYKSIVCEEESYLLELVRYIHLNPIRARLLNTPEELNEYNLTGHKALMGKTNHPWQQTEEVLQRFSDNLQTARKRYYEFIKDGAEIGKQNNLVGGGLIRSMGDLAATLKSRRAKVKGRIR